MTTAARGPNRGHRFTATAPPAPLHPLLAEWREDLRAAKKSKRTVAVYVGTVARFAQETRIDSPVSACRADVRGWFNDHEHWHRNTAAQNFSSLKVWFSWLVREGHRPDNPMATLPKITAARGVPRPISDFDLTRLLTQPRIYHRTRVMIMLAAFAGLRVSEISRIRGKDVDVPGRRLLVVSDRLARTKTGLTDTVPLHPKLAAAAASMPRGDQYWFPSHADPDKPMRPESVTNCIGKVMTRAGVSGTPHALRHYFASTMLANGYDVRTVQDCMRHASIVSTQIYTRVPGERMAEAVASLAPSGAPMGVPGENE